MGIACTRWGYVTCKHYPKVKLVYSQFRTRFRTRELEDVLLQWECNLL